MCTSTASKPARSNAAAISTWPLTPCSRRMATRGLAPVPTKAPLFRGIVGKSVGKAGIGGVEDAVVLLLRALRVVAQRLHAPASSRSRRAAARRASPRRPPWHCARCGSRRGALSWPTTCEWAPRPASRSAAITLPRSAARICSTAPSSSANSAASARSFARPASCVFGVALERVHVVLPASKASASRLIVDAAVPGEGHLAHRGEQAAVGAVVVGDQQPFAGKALDRARRNPSAARDRPGPALRRRAANTPARESSRRGGSCPAPRSTSMSSVSPQIGAQARRQRAARVFGGGEGRDDERQRRDDFLSVPGGAHRQRILAHRDRHAQRRAELQRHRLHRVVQRGVLARDSPRPPSSWPRASRARASSTPRRGQVGERLADRHAAGGRRIDQRQRRALADGERFARVALEIAAA